MTIIDPLLDGYLEFFAKEEQFTMDILDYLVDQELKCKEDQALVLKMILACFPMKKRLEDFDMGFQPALDPAMIRDLASIRFIHNTENAVFISPPGVGKTHLALAFGYKVVVDISQEDTVLPG